MKLRNFGIAAVSIFALLGLSACGDKALEGFQDAPIGQRANTPVEIIENADGFSNASTFCNHGNRLYILFKGDGQYGAVAVAPQDPSCAK